LLTDHLVDNADDSVIGPLVAEVMQQTESVCQLAETQYRLFLRLGTVLAQPIPVNLICTIYQSTLRN